MRQEHKIRGGKSTA